MHFSIGRQNVFVDFWIHPAATIMSYIINNKISEPTPEAAKNFLYRVSQTSFCFESWADSFFLHTLVEDNLGLIST